MDSSKPGTTKAKVLIADDEANARLALIRALDLLGYAVDGVPDGKLALDQLSRNSYDILLLDLRMPEVDGVQVMEFVRQNCPNLAVIVLTAHATLDSAITAVKAGAVDYLLKPQRIAAIEEAIQRALARRSVENQRKQLIGIMEETLQALQSQDRVIPVPNIPIYPTSRVQNKVSLDLQQRKLLLHCNENKEMQAIELTSDQANIVAYMIRYMGKALSNQEIASAALSYHDLSEKEAERIVRPHILRLRRKIEQDPCHPSLIQTVRGVGYTFSAE